MSRIKTRETVKAIKVLDKGAVASERMRSAFIRTKRDAAALVDSKSSSSNEYASDSAEHFADNTVHDAADLTVSGTKTAMRKGREAVEKQIKNRAEKAKVKVEDTTPDSTQNTNSRNTPQASPRGDAPATESTASTAKPQANTPVEQGRRLAQKEASKRRADTSWTVSAKPKATISQPEHTIKTADKSTRTIKQTAKSTGRATIKSTSSTIKTSQRTVKTAEQTAKIAVKTSQATAKAAQKAAVATAKAAKVAAQAAQAAAKAAVVAAKAAAKVIAAAVKAIIAAVKGLIAAIAAGGWVAVLVIVIVVLIVAVIASPFGIFFSGESTSQDTVPASAAIARINYDLDAQLSALQDGDYDDIVLSGAPADWTDVLAVFSVKVAGAEDDTATYVATFDAERIDKLKTVFFDMTAISSHVEIITHPDSDPDDDVDDSWSESILHISVSGLTAEEAAQSYGFSDEQMEMLQELLAEREMLRELIGDLHGEIIEAKEILRALPDDLSPERRAVVETACSLVGKVNYFWGGKSRVIGWDSRWGTLQKVCADGSSTTGTYRPYGLDCSGFVDWVFYNATDGAYYPGQGGGAADQHGNSTNTTWEAAAPGDLVFYPGDEHVGIVGGRDENGNLLIIHCASGYNNVVVTGIEGFISVATPDYIQ